MYPTHTRRVPYADEDFYGFTSKDGCLLKCRTLPTSSKGVFCEVLAFKDSPKESWVSCSAPFRSILMLDLADYAFTEADAHSALRAYCWTKAAGSKRDLAFWEARSKLWSSNPKKEAGPDAPNL